MKRTLLTAVLLAAGVLARGETISVAFPAEGQKLPAVEQTYVIGAVAPGRPETLYVNGQTTAVYRTGAFVCMAAVQAGTNTLTLQRGAARLVRNFVVAAPSENAPTPPPVIASDDSPLLGPVRAWTTTGSLFRNRVRAAIDDGDTLFYLPKGFTLCGAEVKDTGWIAVWLENRRGFLPKRVVVPSAAPVPPKGLIAPNPADGFPDTPPYGKPPSAVRICVDAGHGGDEPGALSPHGWREKEANLMQARAIRDALEKAGFHVIMTRDGDSSPDLFARPQRAYAERVDAFISVHHNATAVSRDPRLARHTTTYASTSNGLALARCIQKYIAQVMAPVPDAGAQLKSLAVCRNPAVPSCLLEVDFINLPEGEEGSWNPVRQKKIAEAVVCGVFDWMTPPEPAPAPPKE